MLLTVPQKYAKSLLKDFGALRKSHVEKILRIKYPHKSYKSEIYQLIAKQEIKRQDDFLIYGNKEIDLKTIAAFDVLSLIADSTTETIQKGKEPFNVTFLKQKNDKLWRYDICVVSQGFEAMVTSQIENINAKYRVIIFVLENPDQQKNIIVPCEYRFAWKKDGEYHFYKEKR